MESGKKPDIKPEWSLLEKILQPLCFIIIAVTVIVFIAIFANLPSIIPTHFGISGKPDSTGSKNSLLFLFIVEAVLYAGLTILERFPKIFNYPCEITESNARFEYQTAREMMVCLKTEFVAVFTYIGWSSVKSAYGSANGLGEWFTAAYLAVLAGTLLFYIRRMIKHRNDNAYKNF